MSLKAYFFHTQISLAVSLWHLLSSLRNLSKWLEFHDPAMKTNKPILLSALRKAVGQPFNKSVITTVDSVLHLLQMIIQFCSWIICHPKLMGSLLPRTSQVTGIHSLELPFIRAVCLSLKVQIVFPRQSINTLYLPSPRQTTDISTSLKIVP